jgi:hypothetical protein
MHKRCLEAKLSCRLGGSRFPGHRTGCCPDDEPRVREKPVAVQTATRILRTHSFGLVQGEGAAGREAMGRRNWSRDTDGSCLH